jgi:hypothetical protein
MPTLLLSLLLVHAAPAATNPRAEWIGVELSPAWLNLSARPSAEESPPSMLSAGLAGTVRLFRLRFPGTDTGYWTPLQAGVGVAGAGAAGFLAHLSTEAGFRVGLAGDRSLEVGLALGAGVLGIEFSNGCDGSCWVGGLPVVMSPVARLAILDGDWLSTSVVVRALVPVVRPTDETRHWRAWAMAWLLGLEAALNR